MSTPETGPFDLERALTAIDRVGRRFLHDIQTTTRQPDPRFSEAFRRWEEQLTHLKLALHRAEQKLLHYLLVPEDFRPWRDLPGTITPQQKRQITLDWHRRIDAYFRLLHIDGRFRRLHDPLDLVAEAITADIQTDMVEVAALVQITGQALTKLAAPGDATILEDLAFYHVISPWKQRGMPALFDVLRWLNEFLAEHDSL
jgi:hypothetical protein